MAVPVIRIVRFYDRVKNEPLSGKKSQLHTSAGKESLGHLRGDNLQVGNEVRVRVGDKSWNGSIYQAFADDLSPGKGQGPAYNFRLTPNVSAGGTGGSDGGFGGGGGGDPSVDVTVTVTNADGTTTVDNKSADAPKPEIVP